MDVSSAPVSYATVLEQRYRSRLPSALAELSGPAHGTVQLPFHVAWSGQTAFDLDRPKPCMHMYRIVLAEGQRGDVTSYLNRDLLVSQWPVLRTLISTTVRIVWESAFPELCEGQLAWADDINRRIHAETREEDDEGDSL
jgi:hypothetical protein